MGLIVFINQKESIQTDITFIKKCKGNLYLSTFVACHISVVVSLCMIYPCHINDSVPLVVNYITWYGKYTFKILLY